MAGFLVDTHALLWWLDAPVKLKQPARDVIANPENRIVVSTASVWEISIKRALGKLEIPNDLEAQLADDAIIVLPVSFAHAAAVAELPLHPHDPFDRMLIAQAIEERLTLITRDRTFEAYDVPLLAC